MLNNVDEARADPAVPADSAFPIVPAQAVLGGITVRTHLNPWTVSGHFLLSAALVYGAYALWHRARETDRPATGAVPAPLRWLARALTAAAGAVIVAGTVVTGSGPHAGDRTAARTSVASGNACCSSW